MRPSRRRRQSPKSPRGSRSHERLHPGGLRSNPSHCAGLCGSQWTLHDLEHLGEDPAEGWTVIQEEPIPVALRNVTAETCQSCGETLLPGRRRAFCSSRCRQAGYRRRRGAQPVTTAPVPVGGRRNVTVYACPDCDTRYLGEQYCPECRTFCTRIGIGGPCPHCSEPVAVDDLTETLTPRPTRRSANAPVRTMEGENRVEI